MKIKFYSITACLLFSGMTALYAQPTAELRSFGGVFNPGQGPSVANAGPVSLYRGVPGNNNFTDLTGADITTVSMFFQNQQYTGLTYSNAPTGLMFGAEPTQATPGTVQAVNPRNIYDYLGSYGLPVGGATSNMFSVSPSQPAGTGIVSGAEFSADEPNGAVFMFTNAQVQFDRPGGPSVHNSSTRYYYGDLVINFNRFIQNPVIHIAGLGGSYRYFPVGGGDQTNPNNYMETFFSTELEVVGVNAARLSGNANFTVSGNSITNSSATPNGGSVDPSPNTNGAGAVFNDYGAASGSIRIVGTLKSVTLKVYLRGSNNSDFPWSATAAQVTGGTRNPLTGDIWSVSVSADVAQLITLPATGMTLTGALNNDNVTLNWKTASEINTKQFEVERSIDGVNYTTIATKDAAGDSPVESRYSVVDPNMNAQVHYYRIKLTDFDGKVSYSNVVVIRKTGAVKAVKTFPNPVVNAVNLEFSNMKGNYTIELFNKGGQLVHSEKAVIASTVQYVVIQRNSMPAGSYSLRIRNLESGEITTEKIIVQ